jgi:hypothetical protein
VINGYSIRCYCRITFKFVRLHNKLIEIIVVCVDHDNLGFTNKLGNYAINFQHSRIRINVIQTILKPF